MKPIDLFGDINAPHACCSCCEDYCPQWESEREPSEPQLYALTIDGTAYLSDRYVAVRADLLDPPQGEPIDAGAFAQKALRVPSAKTGPSDRLFRAAILRRILRVGLTVHQSPDDAQYLYRGDEFAGWINRRKDDNGKVGPAMHLSDVPAVEAYVLDAGRTGWNIPITGDEWDASAAILNEARRLSAEVAS